jgi:hypothetical protein
MARTTKKLAALRKRAALARTAKVAKAAARTAAQETAEARDALWLTALGPEGRSVLHRVYSRVRRLDHH